MRHYQLIVDPQLRSLQREREELLEAIMPPLRRPSTRAVVVVAAAPDPSSSSSEDEDGVGWAPAITLPSTVHVEHKS